MACQQEGNVNSIILDDAELKSFIIGSMLGDGSISMNGINASYKESHCLKQADYCKWKRDIIEKYIVPCWGKYYEYKGREQYRFGSNNSIYFTEIYKLFYRNGKKRVNREILNSLTPLGIAIWFMDDGCVERYKNGKVNTISIATQGFDDSENELICEYFSNVWGLPFYINKANFKNRKRIRLGKVDNILSFFKLVEPYIRDEFKYKILYNLKEND